MNYPVDVKIKLKDGITLDEAVIQLRRRSELTEDWCEALALAQAVVEVQKIADRLAAARKWGADNSVV